VASTRLLEALDEAVDLSTLVEGLFSIDRVAAVRAAALAGRLRFAAEYPGSPQRRIVSWPIELDRASIGVRRALDVAEEWVICPCDAHGSGAHAWAQFHGRGAKPHTVEYLANWAAGLAGEATGRANPLPSSHREADCDRTVLAGVTRQLASWIQGGEDPIRQEVWLPSDRRKLRPFPECPPINWHCQECGAFVRRTADLFPDDADDSDCLEHPERTCSAGYSMTMVSRCSICDHDLLWGDDPCAHFARPIQGA
jgi:hypothetical protein